MTPTKKLRNKLLSYDDEEMKPSIHEFHVRASQMLNRFVPAQSSTDNKELKPKRARTEQLAGEPLAMLVDTLPENLAMQVLRHAFKVPAKKQGGAAKKHQAQPKHDAAHDNAKTGRPRPKWWMCRNCTELGHDFT